MNFAKRTFLMVFGSSFALIMISSGCLLLKNYLDFKSDLNLNLTRITDSVSKTIVQTDKFTDKLLFAAAEGIIQARKAGPLSKSDLISLRNRLHVSDIYLINKKGVYIQSTDSWAETGNFNFFSFCKEYRDFFEGSLKVSHTPILLAYPPSNLSPYKFVHVLDEAHSEIIEIGLKLESIAELFKDTLKAYSILTDVGLYTPNGQKIGSLSQEKGDPSSDLFMERRISPTTNICWQCKIKNLSNTNEYWYTLKVFYSKHVVDDRIQQLLLLSFVMIIIALLVAYLVANFLAVSLSRSIVTLEENLRTQISRRDFTTEIDLGGNDEISSLNRLFQNLMKQVYFYQQREHAAALLSSSEAVAKSLSDEIRDPLTNIEMIVDSNKEIRKEDRRDLNACLSLIESAMGSLLKRHSALTKTDLSSILKTVVNQEQILLAEKHTDVLITLNLPMEPIYAIVNSKEFQRALENLISASLNSIDGAGTIDISVKKDESFVQIIVCDTGKGIPDNILKNIVNYVETFSSGYNAQLGLYQAYCAITKAGGVLRIESQSRQGTKMSVSLPINDIAAGGLL